VVLLGLNHGMSIWPATKKQASRAYVLGCLAEAACHKKVFAKGPLS